MKSGTFSFAQQVDARLAVEPLRLEPRHSLEPAEVALGKNEVVLLHFIHQVAAGFAKPQRRPTILRRLETGCHSPGRAIEVRRLGRIAENLVDRWAIEFVVRQPPGDFGGEVVASSSSSAT